MEVLEIEQNPLIKIDVSNCPFLVRAMNGGIRVMNVKALSKERILCLLKAF